MSKYENTYQRIQALKALRAMKESQMTNPSVVKVAEQLKQSDKLRAAQRLEQILQQIDKVEIYAVTVSPVSVTVSSK